MVTGRAALSAVVETPDQPRCLEQASIRRVMQPWNENGWELVITFAAPEHVSRASLVDTVGVDIEADNLFSLASSTEEYRLPQRLVNLPLPEDPSPSQGVAPNPFSAAQGLACRRQVVFDAYRPAYEAAIARSEGGAYLREQGIYSSQITEWRKLRDAGVLAGKRPGEKIGRLTAEQVEIARLRRELDKAQQRLATTEVALTIMGKAHELLEQLSKSSRNEPPHTKS